MITGPSQVLCAQNAGISSLAIWKMNPLYVWLAWAIHDLKKYSFKYTMSDNKLVKTILDAATLTGIVAGMGWIAKRS